MTRTTLPTINPDGNDPKHLAAEYRTAAGAVQTAYERVRKLPFDACDYPRTWKTADVERRTMLMKLIEIRGQLIDVAKHCEDKTQN